MISFNNAASPGASARSRIPAAAALPAGATGTAVAGEAGFAALLGPQAANSAAPVTAGPGAGSRQPALEQGSEAARRVKTHKSAMEFESMFLGQMLSEMWSGMEVNGNFGGGHGEEMFRGMIVTEYGKIMQKRGGAGIGAQVERELLRAQGLRPQS